MTKGKDQPQAYGDETYWDNRYSQDAGTFDWYQRYAGLAPLINMYIPKQNKILMVGCGNAAISEDMVCDGYQDIVNIDISAVVIEAMREKYKDMPQLQYQRMDVRDMKAFKDGQFDTVLDKGMLDSLMCGASATYSASSMLQEVRRVLKPGGVY
jgi:ubiquinone/menaquinone biosynthesis C-methylase UbiE